MSIYCSYRVYTVYTRRGGAKTSAAASRRQGGRPAAATPRGDARGASRKDRNLDIIISNSSGKPIYEQITDQIKAAIVKGELAEGEQLP